VNHSSASFEGAEGISLHWQCWEPASPPAAILVVVHGFGEHSGRYESNCGPIVGNGIAVYAYDQRGHGRSPGQRGHISGMFEYRQDLDAFVALVVDRNPGVPVFVWGHSMGSLVALDYAIRHPESLRAVITSGVGLEPAGVATPAVVMTARMFSRLWPKFPMKIPLDPNFLTRDRAEVENYLADKLVHNRGSARWAVSLLDAIDWIKSNAGNLNLPILMLHGGADPINLPAGSDNFIDAVVVSDKTLVIYPDDLHEVHRELDRETAISDLIEWISARI
jgi:alpha-beta hydrolase superfamily lysophospholipase